MCFRFLWVLFLCFGFTAIVTFVQSQIWSISSWMTLDKLWKLSMLLFLSFEDNYTSWVELYIIKRKHMQSS